ncbi:MAG: phosphomannomutase/phosphoglucomutase [Magnetococcales bacterium]|nr:phosphomannomutase/phosphoglucomutase [Magnetococcales bacterium]
MSDINPYSFREYDIRGIAGKDLTESVVERLGLAFAAHVRSESGLQNPIVVTGRDGRASSPGLSKALGRGLSRGGAQVIHVGLGPTPQLYFANHHFDAHAGIMITGSHNPPDYNGLKMVRAYKPVFGAEIQAIKERIIAEDYADVDGGSTRTEDILEIYLARLVEDYKPGRPVKAILDCGNGAAGVVAQKLLDRLENVTGEVLFGEVDGTFPNHHPDPTIPENLVDLKQRMKETNADVGIAFDGDGDRIGALDETGQIIWGDRLMILFSRAILAEKPGVAIIGDVKCSQQLFDAITEAGGESIMWKTGHSLVKAKMRESGAAMAGEMSGHLFFADRYYGFDDALYAAVRLVELLGAGENALSSRLADLPEIYSTPELRIECPDDKKFQVMARVVEGQRAAGSDLSDIDGVRVKIGTGWWLMRVSNTQPALVVRAESDSREQLHEIVDGVAKILDAEGVAFPDWQEA